MSGLRGSDFTKNIAFSSLSWDGLCWLSHTIFISWLNSAGIKPALGSILTGMGEDVNT